MGNMGNMGNVLAVKRATLAILVHTSSTDQRPRSGRCSLGHGVSIALIKVRTRIKES